jgi:hypothetical protein
MKENSTVSFCPGCQIALIDGSCSNCGYHVEETIEPSVTASAIRPRQKIPVDLMLAVSVDRTGSSAAFRTGIPRAFEAIIRPVAAKVRSVECQIWSHGDLEFGEEPILIAENATPDAAINAVKSIDYDGGRDPDETHIDQIVHLLQVTPWPAQRSKRGALLIFATAESKPARDGRSARAIGESIRERGILLYLVCEPTPLLYELSKAAHGLIFEISNDPKPDELQIVAGQLSASVLATMGSHGTVPLGAADSQEPVREP